VSLLATPFHARAAEANRLNDWQNRGGFTLATSYGPVEEEAVAARFGAIVADISWHRRVAATGMHVRDFASRLFTRNVAALEEGAGTDVLWLNDAGAVRGAGTVVRTGEDAFLLDSTLDDTDWISGAARLYDVKVEDVTAAQGGLALIGPAALKLLQAAGVDASLPPMAMRKLRWRGLDVTLSRLGVGFELWCEPDAALVVWDRLMAAGKRFALRPVGQAALDILEFESGLMRPGRDYRPALDGFAPQPSPQSLGLSGLVDRKHVFNGRAGVLAAGPDASLAGVLLDSEKPSPDTVLTHQGRVVGRTLSSLFSPALHCAIAFAVFSGAWPASEVMAGSTHARPAGLPFLPIPAPIGATEAMPAAV